jgi:ribosomal protein S18 acetylase RimI-like enzyme
METSYIRIFRNKKGQSIIIKSLDWQVLFKFSEFLRNHVSKSEDFFEIKKIFSLKKESESLTDIMKMVEDGDSVLLCALFENKVIGYITILRDTNHKGDLEIFIHKDHRNKGLGKELILSAIKVTKNLDTKSIYLSVRENNRIAINLYKKLGFTKVEKRDNNIIYKKSTVSQIIMIKRI